MDKIKTLLEKSGCKPELVDQIVNVLDNYKTTVREEFNTEYAAKIEQAKKVCIEETESHKRELARRLQVFCETKSAAIEAQLAKRSALNETEAESRLQEIKNLLEGIQPNGSQNGEITAALKKAKHQLKIANEERQKAIEGANRKVSIAEKVMKQNRTLAVENAKLKDKLSTVTLAESRQRPKNRRIDSSRSKQQSPVSTRPTLFESQNRRPSQKSQTPNITNTGIGYSVNDVAGHMEEDLT